jgi:hypothetical protein
MSNIVHYQSGTYLKADYELCIYELTIYIYMVNTITDQSGIFKVYSEVRIHE